jgi:hypothetical protein
LVVSIFSCRQFSGRTRGGREGTLRWYPEERLPFDRLWPDMHYWLPIVLDEGSVAECFHFEESGERLLSCSLELQLAV